MRKNNTAKLLIIALLGLSIIPIAVHPGRAQIASTGFAVTNYATGFLASTNLCGGFGCGPIGLAFDSSGNLFVIDVQNSLLYKFPPGGGIASASTQLSSTPISGVPVGMTFSKDGQHLFALLFVGDVVELSTSTGTVIRTVASTPAGNGLATDPLSGDLFASAGGQIYRISNFASGLGTATPYSSVSSDGLAFGPDGTLYAASGGTCGGVAKITGTNSATPGTFTCVASVPTIDGMAVSANPGRPVLFGNRNDGIITEVNLTSTTPTLTNIVTSGTRGDFATVGTDGCLYATQTDSIIKVTNADGTCLPPPLGPLFPPGPTSQLKVSKFFTDSSLNPLPLDSNGNSKVDVVLAKGIVKSTNPGQVLAWVNVTNTSGSVVQSLKLNETLPVDWKVDPAWMPALGAIHVYFANTTSLLTNPEITQTSTIGVSSGNPQTVQLVIPSFNATAIAHPLMSGQSILLSVKLTYGVIGTTQSVTSYPRNYTDTAGSAAWTQASFTGTESTGSGSAFFIADAKVVS